MSLICTSSVDVGNQSEFVSVVCSCFGYEFMKFWMLRPGLRRGNSKDVVHRDHSSFQFSVKCFPLLGFLRDSTYLFPFLFFSRSSSVSRRSLAPCSFRFNEGQINIHFASGLGFWLRIRALLFEWQHLLLRF